MDGEKLEVECPVCDHKILADAKRCPNCGADFTVSGMEELEQVAQDLRDPNSGKVAASSPSKNDQDVDDNKKDRLFGRFFKKKR